MTLTKRVLQEIDTGQDPVLSFYNYINQKIEVIKETLKFSTLFGNEISFSLFENLLIEININLYVLICKIFEATKSFANFLLEKNILSGPSKNFFSQPNQEKKQKNNFSNYISRFLELRKWIAHYEIRFKKPEKKTETIFFPPIFHRPKIIYRNNQPPKGIFNSSNFQWYFFMWGAKSTTNYGKKKYKTNPKSFKIEENFIKFPQPEYLYRTVGFNLLKDLSEFYQTFTKILEFF